MDPEVSIDNIEPCLLTSMLTELATTSSWVHFVQLMKMAAEAAKKMTPQVRRSCEHIHVCAEVYLCLRVTDQLCFACTLQQMADMQRQMGNMTPAMMQQQMDMMRNMRPEDVRRAREQMAGMDPATMASVAGQVCACM